MNGITQKIINVGHDTFTLAKAPDDGSRLGYAFRVIATPRSDQFKDLWMRHQHDVRYFALTGALLFDIGDETYKLEKEKFIDIRAGLTYRFRGLEFQPVTGYIFAPSYKVTESWTRIADELKQRAVIGNNGQVRYR